MLRHTIRYTLCHPRTGASGDYYAFEIYYNVEGVDRNCLDTGTGPTPLDAAEDAFRWMRTSLQKETEAQAAGSTYLGDPASP